MFLRIGDVSALTGVPPYVLRTWEAKFPQLRPHKGGGGQRLYRREDVDLIRRIKELLEERRYTPAGVRRALRDADSPRPAEPPVAAWLARARAIRQALDGAGANDESLSVSGA